MTAWQPIESAPRDGTLVLLLALPKHGEQPIIELAQWCHLITKCNGGAPIEQAYWAVPGTWKRLQSFDYSGPDRWAPLPSLPVSEEQANG